jgi:hypothetical protein
VTASFAVWQPNGYDKSAGPIGVPALLSIAWSAWCLTRAPHNHRKRLQLSHDFLPAAVPCLSGCPFRLPLPCTNGRIRLSDTAVCTRAFWPCLDGDHSTFVVVGDTHAQLGVDLGFSRGSRNRVTAYGPQ